MHIELTEATFIDAFRRIRPDNFTLEGLRALYDFLTGTEEYDCQLDVIAICCDLSEYPNVVSACIDKGIDIEDDIEDDIEETARKALRDSTSVCIIIEVSGGGVILLNQ